MSKQDKSIQCQGWRRRGGAFTFGPVVWKQCTNSAVVMLKVKQERIETLPACLICWKECIEKKIKILEATPILPAEENEREPS